jgi:hypothetical protein
MVTSETTFRGTLYLFAENVLLNVASTCRIGQQSLDQRILQLEISPASIHSWTLTG